MLLRHKNTYFIIVMAILATSCKSEDTSTGSTSQAKATNEQTESSSKAISSFVSLSCDNEPEDTSAGDIYYSLEGDFNVDTGQSKGLFLSKFKAGSNGYETLGKLAAPEKLTQSEGENGSNFRFDGAVAGENVVAQIELERQDVDRLKYRMTLNGKALNWCAPAVPTQHAGDAVNLKTSKLTADSYVAIYCDNDRDDSHGGDKYYTISGLVNPKTGTAKKLKLRKFEVTDQGADKELDVLKAPKGLTDVTTDPAISMYSFNGKFDEKEKVTVNMQFEMHITSGLKIHVDMNNTNLNGCMPVNLASKK